METIMDNCSFLKKDLDAEKLNGHLYAFKYLARKNGEPVLTDKVVVRGADQKEAAKEARRILFEELGNKVDIVFTKWIELES